MPAMRGCFVLAAALIALVPRETRAERVSYYRVGAALTSPGALEGPGTYETGYGFNLGVSLPFAHRLAATLDLARDQLGWKDGSEPTIPTVPLGRDDLAVGSALLGVELVARRGYSARPIVSAAAGVALVQPGDAHRGGPYTEEAESESVFAFDLGAGVRFRLPPSHMALRLQAHWLGLAREEFTYVVPIRLQLEF